jgi:hypothetical protein
MTFRVGLFKDGRYEGVVSKSKLTSKEEARKIATRYHQTHPDRDYRAVEFDGQGFMIWKDAAI